MRAAILALQVLISLFLTATIMPALLVSFPAAQNDRVGQLLVIVVFAVSFALIALVWPKRRSRRGASSQGGDSEQRLQQ